MDYFKRFASILPLCGFQLTFPLELNARFPIDALKIYHHDNIPLSDMK